MKIELGDGKKYIHLGATKRENMRGNTCFDLVRGAAGTVLRFELYGKTTEYRPANPTVWLTAKKRHEAAAINFGWCESVEFEHHETLFSIKGAFVFDASAADLPPGEYQIRFTVYEEKTRTRHIFPTDADQSAGILRVIEKF